MNYSTEMKLSCDFSSPNFLFSQMIEKLMYDSLYSHLVSHEQLNPNQSGFRPDDSTVKQLIFITHTILTAFDCNPPLDARCVS